LAAEVFAFLRMPRRPLMPRLAVTLFQLPKGISMATATRKPAKKPAAKKQAAKAPADYVQEAIGDVDRANDRLRTLASDLRVRAEDEVRQFQSSLDRAGEQVRVELGRRAIRAQGSTQALTQLSSEIRKRKAELTK
jgi:hypothetical protein